MIPSLLLLLTFVFPAFSSPSLNSSHYGCGVSFQNGITRAQLEAPFHAHLANMEASKETLKPITLLIQPSKVIVDSNDTVSNAVATPNDAIHIPVWFHILTKLNGTTFFNGQISAKMVKDQMDVLNAKFDASKFQFFFAGWDFTNNETWHFNPWSNMMDIGKALRKGGVNTLNVYTCLIADSQGSYGLGTLPNSASQYDIRDSVMITKYSFPGASYYDGKLLVHEAGHWLGLYHTFEGGCDSEFGDYVDDTPFESDQLGSNTCPIGRKSCPLHDREGPDPIHNFMDYTHPDCQTEFTPLQYDRMTRQYNFFRATTMYSDHEWTGFDAPGLNFTVTDANDCAAQTKELNGFFFTYDRNTRECSVKTPKDGLDGGVMVSANSAQPIAFLGLDFPDAFNAGSTGVLDWQECRSRCAQNQESCAVAVFVKGVCYFKFPTEQKPGVMRVAGVINFY